MQLAAFLRLPHPMNYLEYKETPIIEIFEPFIQVAGLRLLVKLEYLNHETVSGNKWWKLKYNLLQAMSNGSKVLTFGGAYSNHIYATAAASQLLRLQSIGVIRGEDVIPRNETLSFATRNGMKLRFVQRSDYRKKYEPELLDSFSNEFGDFYLIPEGGTNCLALRGLLEFGKMLEAHEARIVVTPVGTAGTIAGLAAALPQKQILGVPVLKQGKFLQDEIIRLQSTCLGHVSNNWTLLLNYHFGGYAKITAELRGFINRMMAIHDLPLDPVYTAKMMFGIYDQISKGGFQRGETILAIHTGGLQGVPPLLTTP
jgi:1-aminocyclopropane-1-carboxylate deaminase